MTKKINRLVMIYFSFLVLLFLSGSLPGIMSEVVYYLAFLLPLSLGIFLDRRNDIPNTKFLLIDRQGVSLTLPCIAPSIGLIILTSYLTSIIIYRLTGVTNDVDVGDSLILALLSHALLPAILEEMLFRYLPMRMLSGYSKRVTVVLSALFFALIHHNLFSIPYAFLAGIIFMALDLAVESIIPSIIIHLVNNTLSILMRFYPTEAIILLLFVLVLISLVVIFIKRDLFLQKLSGAFEGAEKFQISAELVVFVCSTLFLSISVLLGG